MRVLICHNDYGRFSGEENAIETMAKVLETNGHDISWFRRSSADIGDAIGKKAYALFSGIYSFRSRRDVVRIMDSQLIDLVQIQNLYPFLSSSILPVCRERSIPVVMRCPNYRLFCPNGLHLSHGRLCDRCLGIGKEWHCILQNCEDDIFKSTGYAVRNAFSRITGIILDNVNHFLVLSEFQKQRFLESGIPREKLAILPNIAAKSDCTNSDEPGSVVSFVGRVSPEKGIVEFLDAAKLLPNIRFAVAGSLESMPRLKALRLPNVEFKGFLSGHALDDLYQTSRLLVFPSKWYEGFPNVIAKAMTHGKPVIGADLGAIPEIIDNGITGLLFKPGNSRDLAEKIESLWNDQERCRNLGTAGYQKAEKEYSEQNYYRRLIDVYEKVLKCNSNSTDSRRWR